MCDLRLYPFVVGNAKIESLSNYHEDLEFGMPDKFVCKFVEVGLIKLIVDNLDSYSRADTRTKLIKILSLLATHRDCRAYILMHNGLDKVVELCKGTQTDTVYEALNLLTNLQ